MSTSGKHTSAYPAATGPGPVYRARPRWWLAFVLALSCAGPAEQPTSAITLAVTVPAESVDLLVSGPPSDPFPPFHVPLSKAGANRWSASVASIPAGPARSFEAYAFDSRGALVYTGSASLDVVAGTGMSVTLVLQAYPPPPPVVGATPVIRAITATPGVVAPGGVIRLTVAAADPSDGSVGYAWSATCGTFSAPTAQATDWLAPGVDAICSVEISATGTGGSSSVFVPMYVVTTPP